VNVEYMSALAGASSGKAVMASGSATTGDRDPSPHRRQAHRASSDRGVRDTAREQVTMEKSGYQPKRFAVVGARPVGAIVAASSEKGVRRHPFRRRAVASQGRPGSRHPDRGDDTLLAKVARTTTPRPTICRDPPDVVIWRSRPPPSADASTLEGFVRRKGDRRQLQNGIDTSGSSAKHLGARSVLRPSSISAGVPLGPATSGSPSTNRPHHIQELDPYRGTPPSGSAKSHRVRGSTPPTPSRSRTCLRKAVLNACMNPICAVTERRWPR